MKERERNGGGRDKDSGSFFFQSRAVRTRANSGLYGYAISLRWTLGFKKSVKFMVLVKESH